MLSIQPIKMVKLKPQVHAEVAALASARGYSMSDAVAELLTLARQSPVPVPEHTAESVATPEVLNPGEPSLDLQAVMTSLQELHAEGNLKGPVMTVLGKLANRVSLTQGEADV